MSLRKKRSSGYHYRITKYILYIIYILLMSLRQAYLLPASVIMLTHIPYTEMPKCTSCLKAIMVITRRAQACCIKTICRILHIYIFFIYYIYYIVLYYILYNVRDGLPSCLFPCKSSQRSNFQIISFFLFCLFNNSISKKIRS